MANVINGALQTAIDNAAVGEVVTLTSDIVLSSRINVSSVVTLDLNGYKISWDINDGYGAIYVGTKGVLTIVDNSSNKTGAILNTAGAAIGNYGEVIVYGGAFTGNYALYNFYYNNTIYGKSTIYGGTFISTDGNNLSIVNSGDLTINGGTFQSVITSNTLNITAGNIKTLYVSEADYNPVMQSTTVSGGHIVDIVVSDKSENEITVSGGMFDTEIDSKYLADGFELIYDKVTGTYGAVDNSGNANGGLKVIATSSSRIRELVIKNNQLIFIQDLGRIAFDFNNKRVFYNQIVELATEADRLALENPLGGYYFVVGSARLWFYNGEWTPITEEPDEVIFIGVELPELGQEGKLYANTTEGAEHISVWDNEKDTYVVVADKTQEVSDEDIEKLFK